MNRKGYRIGIIGAGLMGSWHAFYAKRLGLHVRVVVDKDSRSAERLARKHSGCQTFSSDDCDWLRNNLVDVVHICTPLKSHVPWAEAALSAGCHAVVEKPLAPSVAETEHLLALAAGVDRRIAAVHQLPFQPAFQTLQRGLELEALGYVQYTAFTAGAEKLQGEHRKKVLLELIPHPVSVFHALDLLPEHPLHWNIVKSTKDDLVLTADVRNIFLQIGISLKARPTRHELMLAGTKGSAFVDFFHGFSFSDSTPVGRAGKITRPFANGLRVLCSAGANLARRVLSAQLAYPGLRQFFSRFYGFDREPWNVEAHGAECLHSAMLIDRLNGLSENRVESRFVGNS